MRTSKKADERQDKIQELLVSKGSLTLSELCQTFDCSEATIRNDLTKLEGLGVLKRVFGGAVATDSTTRNPGITKRLNMEQAEKTEIAEYVVRKIIKPNMIVTLDSGTTNMIIAQKILDYKISCTVVTNSFLVASIVAKSPKVELHLAGGRYDPDHASFHDDVSTAVLESIRSEVCFISPNGIDRGGTVTNSALDENAIKQQMVRQSLSTVILADHTKIGVTGLKIVCHAKDVDRVITDKGATDEQVKMLKDAGFKVEIAK